MHTKHNLIFHGIVLGVLVQMINHQPFYLAPTELTLMPITLKDRFSKSSMAILPLSLRNLDTISFSPLTASHRVQFCARAAVPFCHQASTATLTTKPLTDEATFNAHAPAIEMVAPGKAIRCDAYRMEARGFETMLYRFLGARSTPSGGLQWPRATTEAKPLLDALALNASERWRKSHA